MKRNIIKIDEDKCNGCGQCVTGCAEGALEIINGKAKLVKESYCDGLGACIGSCPVDALTIESRDCDEFDEESVKEAIRKKEMKKNIPHACPGMKSFDLSRKEKSEPVDDSDINISVMRSELEQWPVMLRLLSPEAPYLQGKDLSLLSTCSSVASPDVQWRFIRGKSVAIACPKLDDTDSYVEKLAAMIKYSGLKSMTVVRMEVPCCGGLSVIAKSAKEKSAVENFPLYEVILSLKGKIISKKEL